MLDIWRIKPNATKSAAFRKSIVRFCDMNHINARDRTGISPTSTVYISHLTFTFAMSNLLLSAIIGTLPIYVINEIIAYLRKRVKKIL